MGNSDNSICFDLGKYYHDLRVAVYQGENFYLESPPFNPHLAYPGYLFPEEISDVANPGYEAIRNCFKLLGLDCRNLDSPRWSPLRDFVQPGDKVVVKPNFVLSSHAEGGNLFSIITHPSMIRAVIDFIFKALDGQGEIVIADAPQMDCHFEELLGRTQLTSIQELYW